MTQLRRYAKWNGTPEEWHELQIIITRHCACQTPHVCASHDMVVRDQRAIDGLVFIRRIVNRLLAEEFLPAGQISVAERVGDQTNAVSSVRAPKASESKVRKVRRTPAL